MKISPRYYTAQLEVSLNWFDRTATQVGPCDYSRGAFFTDLLEINKLLGKMFGLFFSVLS